MLIRAIKYFILVTVLAAYPLKGNIFYVHGSDPNSDDTNPGTFDLPFKSIQRAANAACAGDTVFIRQGVYKEGFFTNHNGDLAQGHIVFSSYKGEKVILEGEDVNTTNTGIIIQNDYIKLTGIEIADWNTGIWLGGAGFTEISGCEVHDVSFGIGAGNGAHDFILNNVEIHHFDLYGFDASPSGGADCYNGTLVNCTAHTSRDPEQNVDGFALGHGTQHNFTFTNCTTYNVFDGFDISSRDVIIDRCIAYNCSNGGFKLWQDNIKLINSISYNCEITNVELDWDGQPGASTLINCTFYGAKVFSIWVENAADTLKMYNCIIAGGDNIGLAFEQTGNLNYFGDYNIFHSNNSARAVSVGYNDEFSTDQVKNGEWAAYSNQDFHSKTIDSLNTLFMNLTENDLHLKKEGIAVDNGTADNAPFYDFEGNARPSGKAWDIGAYEYQFETGINFDETKDNYFRQQEILQNYPNPFNSSTKIVYSISEKTNVDVFVCAVNGVIVKRLFSGCQNKGDYSIIWDGTDESGKSAGNGIYLTVVKYGAGFSVIKIALLK